ncbi:MAG TPA: HAMP domain-containing sensor histidine kinase [Streptosporangiaceae bacterium]|nr:HAMP domain-containing sensor histidine kinase [Streptosporangiaceae bacterium]
MRVGQHQDRDRPRRRVRIPGLARRTVRLRLTALYGILFLVSGAVLLAIAGGFAISRSSMEAATAPATMPTPQSAAAKLASANALIRQLRHQLSAQAGTTHSAFSRDLLIASAIALGFMTLGSVAMGWVLAGRALRPVRAMTAATQQISAHNLNERLAVAGPDDELKKLGDTIDGLLQRLEAAFNAQRRFVANASHELRTPLATIRASLDVAVAKPEGAPPQTIALAGRLRAELDRIDSLLEAFLVLARAQHRDLPGYAVLPLDYIVGAALADQKAAIGARNLTVQDRTGPGGAWVRGSQALLSRMVENLVDNAVCHNEVGGWLQVTAQTEAGRARLIVDNGGQVLDPRQVDELSQPFRRLGADRIGTDKGSGLGLSIVAAIAEAHDGRLSLLARPGGGLRACVDLPAAAWAEPTLIAGVPA